MPSYSRHDVVLVRYPFTDLSNLKVRPAIIVSVPHVSQDVLIVPLTSQTASLLLGEFVLSDWQGAGLNVETAVKRGVYTLQENLIIKRVGKISDSASSRLDVSLHDWFGI